MNGLFEQAAVAIFIAMVLDGLDGRVARLTRTQSAFGAEYDSLSDMVSFGVAPALIVVRMGAPGHGQAGLDGRLHLLRGRRVASGPLQHQHRRGGQALFPGLPQPAAGVAGRRPGVGDDRQRHRRARRALVRLRPDDLRRVSMVSNVLFYSGKEINLRRSVPFIVIIAIVLVSCWCPAIRRGAVRRLPVLRGVVGLRAGRGPVAKAAQAALGGAADLRPAPVRRCPPDEALIPPWPIERPGRRFINNQIPPGAIMNDQLIIFDTTLRDGEQSPGAR